MSYAIYLIINEHFNKYIWKNDGNIQKGDYPYEPSRRNHPASQRKEEVNKWK